MERIVTYRAVAWSFFRVGAGAFGGGWASLPVFAAELAGRRGWFEEGELAEMFALAQSVPGVILVNFAVLAGGRLKGKPGAVLAGTMAAMPAFLLILGVAAAYGCVPAGNAWVRRVLLGLQTGVVALIASAGVNLARRNVPRGWKRAAAWGAAVAAVAVAMLWTEVPLWAWLVGGALGGAAWEGIGKKGGGA
ncbi:MAG: chromate transporter [Kiritimatiellae bacterium]|nr:chromate transporter [Kiritimatiellia bacterium]